MTGVETKVALNMRQPPSKLGVVERQLNWIVIGLFLTLAAIVVVASVCAGVLQARDGEAQWYMGDIRLESGSRRALISLGSFMILFNTHVPVSLFVTLEYVWGGADPLRCRCALCACVPLFPSRLGPFLFPSP